ncbi:hypothetical protein SAMN06265222_12291 [Neorhodopirellula lusitana]|uniref:Secreted protein n=1 Tax=Neorhodopirellula lusitana TaxID=445327 RepID=A0ABY1QT82_9BACT|nr:hypothetical protein [Neorhodopirellula lusitana]SMP77083.1 hypothetical protein SAMN06265222_12291 [Neorhodopirellula lusitana]
MSIRILALSLSLCTLAAVIGCGEPKPSVVSESASESDIAAYKALQKEAQEATDSEL